MGQVLHYDDNIHPTICITDYTTSVINDPDTISYIPYNCILTIKLFGKHSHLLNKIKKDEFFYFKNIRIHSFTPILEAYMHDSLEGDIVAITDESDLFDIKGRREQFLNHLKESKDGLSSKTHLFSDNIESKKYFDDNNVVVDDENLHINTMKSKIEKTDDIDVDKLNAPNNCDISNEKETLDIDHNSLLVTKEQDNRDKVDLSDVKRKKFISKFVNILTLTEPGAYLSKCHILKISNFTENAEEGSLIYVKEGHSLIPLKAKGQLTEKIMKNLKILIDKLYVFLVYKAADENIYAVDLFLDDAEFEKFENFCNEQNN